jgi:hypothetical protein
MGEKNKEGKKKETKEGRDYRKWLSVVGRGLKHWDTLPNFTSEAGNLVGKTVVSYTTICI